MVDQEQVPSEIEQKYSYNERSVNPSAYSTLLTKTYDSKPKTTMACRIVATMKAHVHGVLGIYILDRSGV
jgi:hypothetical protein